MKNRIGVILKIIVLLAVLFIFLILVCNVWISQYAGKRIWDNVDEVPMNKTGLLLGTSPILSDGTPNAYFVNRIRAASQLYNAGKVQYILVSGDNRRVEYNEPEDMKNALIRAGIPENRIYLDYAGFRTLDSVVRAKEIFGQKHFTVISQKFHNERAIFLASRYGIDATGYNALDVTKRMGIKTKIRELFARVKVFVDFAVNKKPRFLGEKIEIP